MASTIKVDQIETVAGTGTITLPSSNNLTVGGNATVTGTSTLTGNVTASGTLGVTGEITASNTINVNAGLKFPATVNNSSDANVLDDYEEGEFQYGFSATGSVTVRAGYTSGRYTKIGRVCYLQLRFEVGTDSATGGDLYITGLPFTSAAAPSGGNNSMNFPVMLRELSGVSNFGHGFVTFSPSTTQARFQYVKTNSEPASITGANITSGFQGSIDFNYVVA